jgi:two-component system, sensor histidine kinase and response regulator
MDEDSLYNKENQVISDSAAIVEDEANHSNPLFKPFAALLDNYKKLFRQFSRIIRINDKQQRELVEARDELRILNATKDKFFSIISHDLKSPIVSFLSMASLLNRKLDRLSPEDIKEMAASVSERGDNLMKLMENLLHWSRLQMKRIEFNPQVVPLLSLIDQVIYVLEAQATEKKIDIEAGISDDVSLRADPDMLNTILRNLVSNAIKFTPENGLIKIESSRSPDAVEISITDSGVGISKENLDKLFRLDIIHTDLGTNREIGTGLGLILCKEMVDKHDGTISITSQEGQGTTVTFTIPG